ncbi:MAG: D-aminoacyl-tRNA deacylase [Actinomycetota bacterium]
MRMVLQRVSRAAVSVGGDAVARIGSGYLLLVGVEDGDDAEVARRMAAKVASLRLFPGDEGRGFDRPLADVAGAVLVVSQFTLMGDVRKGNRPSWAAAAAPDAAAPLVEDVASHLEEVGIEVARGVFGAMMEVSLVNDGPVTLVLDSRDLLGPRRG